MTTKIFFDSYKKFFLFIMFVSFFALLSAYFVEYIIHILPCPLCLYQRIPYFLLLAFSSVGFFLKRHCLTKYICYLCAIIFLFGSLIGLYHASIERGIIEESISCSAPLKSTSIDSLREEINNNNVSCKEVKFRIASLSMAEINSMFSFGMFIYLLLGVRKIECENIRIRESLERMGIRADKFN